MQVRGQMTLCRKNSKVSNLYSAVEIVTAVADVDEFNALVNVPLARLRFNELIKDMETSASGAVSGPIPPTGEMK